MSYKLSEDKYKKLKKEASKNISILELDKLSPEERIKVVYEHADSLIFDNEEEKQMYIANLLIPNDEEFYVNYMKHGKALKKVAEVYGVPQSIVMARSFELQKYQEYLGISKKKGDSKMNVVEIIDIKEETIKDEEKKVKEEAVSAASKVTQFCEQIESQRQIIESQSQTITNQNEEIISLDSELADARHVIDTQEAEIARLKLALEKEQKEKELAQKTAKLYKEQFAQLVSVIDQGNEEKEKSEKTIVK